MIEAPRDYRKAVLLYPLRKEAEISGERYAFQHLHDLLRGLGLEVPLLRDAGIKTSSYASFFSPRRFTFLRKLIRTNPVGTLIVKVPTASQLIWLPFLLRGYSGRTIAWVDGLMWTTPPPGVLAKLLRREFLATVARLLLNHVAWCLPLKLFRMTVVVASETQKRQLARFLSRDSTVTVIPNGLHEEAGLCAARPAKGGGEPGMTFGYLGHSYPVKGVRELVGALRRLASEGLAPPLKMALSGRGPEVRTKGLGGGVSLAGRVDRDAFYDSIHCLVAPYLVAWGTNVFPSVLLEALAKGVPVVVSDTPVARELFDGIDPMVFVRPGDERSLAEAIKSLCTGRRSLPSADRLRESYHRRFGHAVIKAQWMRFLKQQGVL